MFDLIDNAHIAVPGMMLVMARLSGMFLTFPVFSSNSISNRIKIAMVLLFTLVISPNFYQTYPKIENFLQLGVMTIKELCIGFTLGFGTSVIFETFSIAGMFIGRQIGLSMAQSIDPNTNNQTEIISQIFLLLMTVYFLISNGHYLVIETFYKNFKLIPLGTGIFSPVLGRNIVHSGSDAFRLALNFAGPTLIFMLLVESAVAITVRVMPEMNAFFITLPLRIGCGVFALINSLNIFQLMYPTIYEFVYQYIGSSLSQLRGV
ncbi:MAG: flagellar biosynthetic protein FliR [Candidatus Marinimicrobia bacterium]|nr:flagellar biosynthetic protein FliR [Candidatus Neomarinimicrobiota bacterium]